MSRGRSLIHRLEKVESGFGHEAHFNKAVLLSIYFFHEHAPPSKRMMIILATLVSLSWDLFGCQVKLENLI
jgi:hypothetical protein